MSGFLNQEVFGLVVASTPLISIDLILKSQDQRILLGERLNRPAQGFWFVPGGRIYKNEKLDAAFSRIVFEELGLERARSEATFLGAYEHMYQDSQFGEHLFDSSTHYVVLAYAMDIDAGLLENLPKLQHGDYRLLDSQALMACPQVHQHTKNYFLNDE